MLFITIKANHTYLKVYRPKYFGKYYRIIYSTMISKLNVLKIFYNRTKLERTKEPGTKKM